MSLPLSSQVHASSSPPCQKEPNSIEIAIFDPPQAPEQAVEIDYSVRAQWLRAAVLGANDGLVSVASLMIGVGAINQTPKAMLISGIAGLVAGACSMAIGEFVSVYAQYDMELAQMKRENNSSRNNDDDLPSPWRAAVASALAFALGALLPLLAGGFIKSWAARIAAVCATTTVSLAGFGAIGAMLGGVSPWWSAVRVLLGGWAAMGVSYGVLRLFGLASGTHVATYA